MAFDAPYKPTKTTTDEKFVRRQADRTTNAQLLKKTVTPLSERSKRFHNGDQSEGPRISDMRAGRSEGRGFSGIRRRKDFQKTPTKRARRIRRINERGRGELLSNIAISNLKRRRLGNIKTKVIKVAFKRGKGFSISISILSWVITVWFIQLFFYTFSILALVFDEADIFGFFGVVSGTLYLLVSLVIVAIGWGSLLVASIQYKLGGIHCFFGKNAAGKIFLFTIAAAAYGPWPGNFGPWILLWMVYVAYHPE